MNVTITSDIPANFIFYAFVVAMIVFVFLIFQQSKNPANSYNWVDLILDPVTKKASITRTSQMIGVITATFIVVYQVMTKQLTSEMFAMYMFSLGASSGFSQWVNVKYKDKIEPDATEK